MALTASLDAMVSSSGTERIGPGLLFLVRSLNENQECLPIAITDLRLILETKSLRLLSAFVYGKNLSHRLHNLPSALETFWSD